MLLTPRLKKLRKTAWTYEDIPDTLAQIMDPRQLQEDRLVINQGGRKFIVSLARATPKQSWNTLIFMSLATILNGVQPYFVEMVMVAYKKLTLSSEVSWSEFLTIAMLIPTALFIELTIFSHYLRAFTDAYGIQRRIIMGRIFDHWLKISPGAKAQLNHGDTQNLMGIDGPGICNVVERFADAIMVLIQIVIACALLTRYFGSTALVSIGLMIVLIPITNYLVKESRLRHRSLLICRDSRMNQMTQIFSAIKTIKLSGWDEIFSTKAKNLRKKEVDALVDVTKLDSLASLVYSSNGIVVATITYGIHLWRGGSLSPELLFPTLLIFTNLAMPFNVLKDVIRIYAQTQVSARRILTFLLLPVSPIAPDDKVLGAELAITIDDLSFAFPNGKKVLRGINLQLRRGESLAIVGSVGCGKTTLIRAILGELGADVDHRICKRDEAIAYCCQEPFLSSGSLTSNLSFFREGTGDVERVLAHSGLSADVSMWAGGIETEIGERGINLSGGQKQRVCLARSAYFTANTIVLDDPLSAVDIVAEDLISDRLIFGDWKDKTRICATHRLTHLHRFDRILFLDREGTAHIGNITELSATLPEFREFMELESRANETRSVISDTLAVSNELAEKELQLVTSEHDSVPTAAGQLWRKMLWQLARGASQKWPTIGGLALALLVILAGVMPLIQQYWMSLATDQSVHNSLISRWSSGGHGFFPVYTALTVVVLVTSYLGQYIFRICCIRASTRAHDEMLAGVLGTSLRFFDTTPTGRLINRFSADLVQTDVELAARGYRLFGEGTAFLARFAGVAIQFPGALVPMTIGLISRWRESIDAEASID
jgi:ABC-type multidrug transport system fused ATPase/permease subunit